MRKIMRTEKRGDLYVVYFDDGHGGEFPAYQTPEGYRVTMLKQKLIGKGYSEEDLEEFEDALGEHFEREHIEEE